MGEETMARVQTVVLLVAALSLPLCAPMGASPQGAGQKAAFIGTVWSNADDGGFRAGTPATFNVIGGYVAGKGWMAGERAKQLIHRGDRVLLSPAEVGAGGEIELTDSG